MIKSDQEFYIKSQQQLIVRLMKLLDWVLECEKKVHKAETDSWYLNWKVSYLEKKLKELDIPLIQKMMKKYGTFTIIKKSMAKMVHLMR